MGSEPQRALVNTIVVGHEAIDSARRQLDTRMQFPELGTDPVSDPGGERGRDGRAECEGRGRGGAERWCVWEDGRGMVLRSRLLVVILRGVVIEMLDDLAKGHK